MALTLATELANYAAGIGTQGATLKIDTNNKRVGVGTTNPQGPEGSLQVGTGITFFGNTGIISAIGGKFSGDFTVGGTLTYEDVQNVNSSGIVTAQAGINIVGGGLTVTGVSTFFGAVNFNGNLDLQDDDKILLGTGDDLQIYHDGSNSYIQDAGTGDLRIDTNAFRVRNAAGDESMIVAINDGAVELYHNNSKKFETTATGVIITGIATATEGLVLDGQNGSGKGLRLDLAGSGDYVIQETTTNDIVQFGGTGSANFFTHNISSGNIGIGTATPTEKLHVFNRTANGGLIHYDGASNSHFGLRIRSNSDGGNFESDFANGTTAMLDLFADAGTVSGGDFLVCRSQAATPILLVKGNGKVGIATADPQNILDIEGSDHEKIIIGTTGNNHATGLQIIHAKGDAAEQMWQIQTDGSADGNLKIRNATGSTDHIFLDADNDETIFAGAINVTGIATATQLFEGSSRVATAGKAVAMALVFG